MKSRSLPRVDAQRLLVEVNHQPRQSLLANEVIREATDYVRSALDASFGTLTYSPNEEIVHHGVLQGIERVPQAFAYSLVPLGLVLSGEIVVVEFGKAVKRLLPGDLVGGFEVAHLIHTDKKVRIGNWSLFADSEVELLVFDESLLAHSPFAKFLVESARQDIVPKPISELPLLDWIAAELSPGLLENTLVLAHTHLLPTNMALFRHIASLVGQPNLYVVEKPYSTIRSAYRKLVQSGVDVLPVLTSENLPYDFALHRSIDALWSRAVHAVHSRDIKRIVLLDDGGTLPRTVPWDRLQGIQISGIEQTTSGLDLLRRARGPLPPIVDVATSTLKKHVESTFIAKAVVNKLIASGIVDEHRQSPRVGVVGLGSIGNAVRQSLQEHNVDVQTYDVANSGSISSLDSLLNACDVIIGCTGSDFLAGIAFDRVSGSKTMVSASSTDIEFACLLNMAGYPDTRYGPIHVQVHSNLDVTVVNGGFPINFDRTKEWEAPQDIQLTRALLYAGFLQALSLSVPSDCDQVVALDLDLQKRIYEKFKELRTF